MDNLTIIKRLFKPVLLITCIVLLVLNHITAGIIVLIVYAFDTLYNMNKYWEREDDITETAKLINKNIKESIFTYSYPVVFTNENGDILWYNDLFKKLASDENILGSNILNITKGVSIDAILNDSRKHKRITVNHRKYDVNVRSTDSEKNQYIFLFNDVSDIIDSNITKESIMLIEVDNIDEVASEMDENDRPLLRAEIERKIKSYAGSLNAMIEKYDDNKFVLSVQNAYVKDEINNQFKIMDEISKIEMGNPMEITLSIGVGYEGTSPKENYKNAKFAKELALGRGGAQTVVKTEKDIKFFGGTAKEVAKRTKVKARVVANALKELIYESSKVFIAGHSNPDMDCVGAAVGLYSIIRQMGQKCSIILNKDVSAVSYYIDLLHTDEKYKNAFKTSNEAKEQLDEKTLVIIVDVHNKSYISDLELANMAERKAIIDHHRKSPDIIEGDILSYIEVFASSTSEMVTELIQYMANKPKITRLEAEGLLAGIFMDTKNFTFKTGVRTFEAASYLKSLGADPIEVKKMFADDLESYLLIADTIKSAVVENKIAIAVAPDNEKVDTVTIAKSADELLNISGIMVSFVLGKINNDVYISGRALGELNVQRILEKLGGGGHMNIAGARVADAEINDVIEKLKASIEEELRIGD